MKPTKELSENFCNCTVTSINIYDYCQMKKKIKYVTKKTNVPKILYKYNLIFNQKMIPILYKPCIKNVDK